MSTPQHQQAHHQHVRKHLDALHGHHSKRMEHIRQAAEQAAAEQAAKQPEPPPQEAA